MQIQPRLLFQKTDNNNGQGLRGLCHTFEVAMSSKTQIANKTMIDLGEALFADVDTEGTNPANVFNAAWDINLPEALENGPELGWKFATRWFHTQTRTSTSITVFADYSGTVTGTVLATDTGHPYFSGEQVEISSGSVGSYDGIKTITKVNANSYYFTDTFVSTETATAKWTSERYAYRYARPTSTVITQVQVGGLNITDWVREGDFLLTNQEDTSVDINYVLAASDLTITNFPPHFVDVLWRRMSAALAYDLVQNQSLSNDKFQKLEQVYLPRAKGMDAREQFVQESSNSWVTAGHSTGIEGDVPLNPVPTIFKR